MIIEVTKPRFRSAVLTVAIIGSAAAAGLLAVPSQARANPEGAWDCSNMTDCSIGDNQCCTPGDAGTGSWCSTICPIIITPNP